MASLSNLQVEDFQFIDEPPLTMTDLCLFAKQIAIGMVRNHFSHITLKKLLLFTKSLQSEKNQDNEKQEECISVGCIPSARYHTEVSLTETPLDRDPPRQRPPSWTETVLWTETPLDRDPPVNRMTHLCKNITFPNFIAGGNKVHFIVSCMFVFPSKGISVGEGLCSP